jgi:hypothetical protein
VFHAALGGWIEVGTGVPHVTSLAVWFPDDVWIFDITIDILTRVANTFLNWTTAVDISKTVVNKFTVKTVLDLWTSRWSVVTVWSLGLVNTSDLLVNATNAWLAFSGFSGHLTVIVRDTGLIVKAWWPAFFKDLAAVVIVPLSDESVSWISTWRWSDALGSITNTFTFKASLADVNLEWIVAVFGDVDSWGVWLGESWAAAIWDLSTWTASTAFWLTDIVAAVDGILRITVADVFWTLLTFISDHWWHSPGLETFWIIGHHTSVLVTLSAWDLNVWSWTSNWSLVWIASTFPVATVSNVGRIARAVLGWASSGAGDWIASGFSWFGFSLMALWISGKNVSVGSARGIFNNFSWTVSGAVTDLVTAISNIVGVTRAGLDWALVTSLFRWGSGFNPTFWMLVLDISWIIAVDFLNISWAIDDWLSWTAAFKVAVLFDLRSVTLVSDSWTLFTSMSSSGLNDTFFVVFDLVLKEIVVDLSDLSWTVLLLIFNAIAADFATSDSPVTIASFLWTRVAMFSLWTDIGLHTFSPFALESVFKRLVATGFFNLGTWADWWFVWATATLPLATFRYLGRITSAPPLWTFVASFFQWKNFRVIKAFWEVLLNVEHLLR